MNFEIFNQLKKVKISGIGQQQLFTEFQKEEEILDFLQEIQPIFNLTVNTSRFNYFL